MEPVRNVRRGRSHRARGVETMPSVTIRVLEGLERGKVFDQLSMPITIGREDDNDVQLNDERVSRFHAKLQDDQGSIILTDLDSTNGTRVNGHPIQMRVVQDGDVVSIGRCVLQFGVNGLEGQPPARKPASSDDFPTAYSPLMTADDADEDLDFVEPPAGLVDHLNELFPNGAPGLPEHLRPLQRAQLNDVLQFIHARLGRVIEDGVETDSPGPESRRMVLSRDKWLGLVNLQADLASYLRGLSDPGE